MERKIQGLAALISLVIVAGLLHGLSTGRWQFSADRLEEIAPRVKTLPMVIGSWSGVDQTIEEEEQFTRHGMKQWIVRRYTDRRTGQEVEIMVVCGRPGPVAVHTPDVCYKNNGFQEETSPVRTELPLTDGQLAQFLHTKFIKTQATVPTKLDIWWCWGLEGQWSAPESPRTHFARNSYLFKLYVIRNLPLGARQDESCTNFIRDCLPTITSTLFPPEIQGDSSPR